MMCQQLKEQIQKITDEVISNNDLSSKKKEVERYVKRAIDQVFIICNRTDLPDKLESTVSQVVEDMLKADGVIVLEDDVASVSRGDTSISYKSKVTAYQRTVDFMKDYQNMLMHFKKPKLVKRSNRYE